MRIKDNMKKHHVMGVHAPTPRLTLIGLTIVAFALALPVGGVLWLAEWLWW